MSHADHQDYLADPEPLTPPDRAWEQVNERYKALLDALVALEQQMRTEAARKRALANERFAHSDPSVCADGIRQSAYASQLTADADQLQALRTAHGGTT